MAEMLSAPGVQAAAFYISEFGTPGSLGTAGVANTTNTFGADSAFTNPAGMTGLEQDAMVVNADWEEWWEFSDNFLSVQGGVLNPQAALDREWKDTWHAGIAAVRHLGDKVYSMGASYDSSPVSDGKRTIDLPMDEQFKLSAGMGLQGTERLSLGATLMYGGEGKVDQTAQGVRFKGKFDTNLILFVGGSVRYVY